MFPGMDPAAMQQMMNSPQFAGMRQMMQSPDMQQMLQQLTADPSITDSLKQMQEAANTGNVQNIMQSIQGNPKVMQFVQQIGQQLFSTSPMFQALRDPTNKEQIQKQMEELQQDPELSEIMKDIQTQGPSAMSKYWNDPEIIKKFSKYGERLAQTGSFPGMQGDDSGDVDKLTRELEGANLDAQNGEEEEFVCLQDAVMEGDLELLKDVLEAGIPVDDADEENRTALHFACGYEAIECATELISRGADINIKDSSGNTPLHYAAGYGKVESVKLLLAQGALDKEAKNKEGLTAIEVAKVNDFKEISDLLSA